MNGFDRRHRFHDPWTALKVWVLGELTVVRFTVPSSMPLQICELSILERTLSLGQDAPLSPPERPVYLTDEMQAPRQTVGMGR
ncbi:hypothetical protein ABW19_dt0205230 [Dactylella cylindrospora]|nr:hypothetical protein ABW19_dt0205230 [Dactylella cylindrospora]